MNLIKAKGFDQFEKHADDWDELLYKSEAGIFLTSQWLKVWSHVYAPENTLIFYMIYENGCLMCGLPVVSGITRAGIKGRVACVAGVLDWVNDLDFLTQSHNSNKYINAILRNILKDEKLADVFIWDIVKSDNKNLKFLPVNHFNLFKAITLYYKRYPYLSLKVNFPDTVTHVSKKLLKQLDYYIRRINKDGHIVSFSWINSTDKIEQLMERLFTLHQVRWDDKAKRETAFLSSKSKAFHLDIARAFAIKGYLRLAIMKIDNEITAILYGYVFRNKFYFIQHGFDPKWQNFSPGHLLIKYSIQSCIKEGLQYFDFMRGRQEYKLRWCSQADKYITVFVSITLKGRLALLVNTLSLSFDFSKSIIRPPVILFKKLLPKCF